MNTNHHIWLNGMIILLIVTFFPTMAMAEMTDQQKKMINQLDQLDQLDHLEFTAQTDKANTCIRARDYSCAEKKIAKAARYAINSADRNTLRLAKQNLAAERRREQEELEAVAVEQARQMRLAEEQRRIAQAKQRQREAEAEASGFQWGKAGLGIGVGLLAGGRMSSEAKIQYIEGIVKDSMPGQEGLSNTTANANAYADKQKALKIIADQQSRQQLLKGIAEETANNERLLKASRESRQPKNSAVEQRYAGPAGRQAATAQSPLPPKATQQLAVYDTNGLVTSDPAPSPFTSATASGGYCGSLTSVLGISVMQPPPNATGTDALRVPCEQLPYRCLDFPAETVSIPGVCIAEVAALKSVQCRADWLKSRELRDYIGCLATNSSGGYRAYYTNVLNLLR